MLDVFMDRSTIASFVYGVKKSRKEIDISKLNRLIKSEAFVKHGCRLTLDAEIETKAGQVLAYFTQGIGDNKKPSFSTLTAESVTKNKWSVALLDSSNEINEAVSKHTFVINRGKLWDDLEALLFSKPEQTKMFPIITVGLSEPGEPVDFLKAFNGWNTLIKHPLVPLTDAIIIDSYFLKPEAFRDLYGDFDLSAYVEDSLIPLLKLLSKYALNEHLTVNIFTEFPKDVYNIAEELFSKLEKSVKKHELGINLVLVLTKFLKQHKRILYTNYFSLKTGLSFYHFKSDEVTGYKKDEVSIYPYASDNPSTDPHSIMLMDLAEFYALVQKPATKIYGDKANLSPMLIQAHKQLNPANP